ncbi:hypothetical protein SLE2022_188730 [Rubroshorea leprosula]
MDPPSLTSGGKLRLMCSYGGHIIPRPHSKSLCYLGGETRIVSVPASTALSVSSLIAHLASTLHITTSFTVKYQLPHHDLDALISIANEDDLQIMLEELESLSASPDPSRIRLFLFPIKPTSLVFTQSSLLEVEQPTVHRREGSGGGFGLGLYDAELIRTELSQVQSSRSGLNHPKTESWFVDALRSAKIVQKGESGVAGFGAESGGSGQSEGNGLCGQESIALETSSSFGSTSSSVSLSNLPPIKNHGEDNLGQFRDCKPKLPSSESSIASDSKCASGISCVQSGTCQYPFVPICAMESKISVNPYESDNKIYDLSSGIQMHTSGQVSEYPTNPNLNLPQQRNVQIIHAGSHPVSHNPPGLLPVPVASYIPVYQPMLQQQQPHYHSNQPFPLYHLPVTQTQQYNYAVQRGLVHTPTFATGQPQMHLNPSGVPPPLVLKEVGVASVPVPDLTSQVYRNAPTANQVVHVNYNKTEQDPIPSQIHHQPQSFAVAVGETTKYNNELDDDPARIQIYKSQPPPPTLPSQYQTMTKATTALLSEALAQLHTNDPRQ